MLGDGHPNSGTKGSWFKFQWGVLKLLESIASGGVGDASAANQVIEIAAINNLGKVEGSPHIPGGTGVMALGVRNDAGLPLDPDLTYIPFTTDATGAIRTTAVGGSGGIAQPDKSAFVEGLTSFNPIGGVFNDAPAGPPAEDEAAAARITAARGLHVNLRDAAGVEQGTLAAPLRTDPTGTTTQPVSAVNLDIRDLTFATDKVDTSGSTVTANEDKNYGVVGANTLRTAAQIGNATGAADFGAGVTTAQTLRAVLVTDQTPIPTTLPSGAQVLTSSAEAAGSGTVTAGATSVMFVTDSTFTGSINGVARPASTTFFFEAAQGKTLPAIPWVVTTGNMNIDKLV